MRWSWTALPLALTACGLETAGAGLEGDDASVAVDASKLPDASKIPDATTPDAPAIIDASPLPDVVAIVDANSIVDAGSDAKPDPGVFCNNTFCNPATQLCCATTTLISCTAKNQCSGAQLHCDSAGDCSKSGDVCCGGLVPLAATCKNACGAAEIRLCDPNAGECNCQPSGVAGYYRCL